jgi:hypothetical protein
VYPYFVLVIVIAVCIMLNLIVAFFVEGKFPIMLTVEISGSLFFGLI